MARSPAVWVVTENSNPVAAFTVRHELCTWLWKRRSPKSVKRLSGWKVADGDRHWISGEAAGPWPLDLAAMREEGMRIEESRQRAKTWPQIPVIQEN